MTDLFGRRQGAGTDSQSDDIDLLDDSTDGARWWRRHLAGGVVAVSTVVGPGEFRAVTATSAISVSLDPPMYLVSIELNSQMDDALLVSGVFGLSILTREHQFFADQFAGFAPRHSRTFDGIDHFVSQSGSPLLTTAIAWADCRVTSSIVTGDHRCYFGEALAVGAGHATGHPPLVYYNRRYRQTL